MYEELKRTKMEHVGYKTHINVVSMKFSKISPKNCYLLVKERDNQIKSDDTLSMPVSYTHLDVYKRQTLGRAV